MAVTHKTIKAQPNIWACWRENLWPKLFVGMLIGIVFAYLDYLDGCKAEKLFIPFISCLVSTYLIWSLSNTVALLADRWMDWEVQFVPKLTLMMALNTTSAIVILYGVIYVTHVLKGEPMNMVYFTKNLINVSLITVVINMFFIGSDFFNYWTESKLEVEQLKRQNLKSQLEGLKNQVNPHFLFNSLNTLVSIIDEDTETAKNFVMQLSQVYRYILQSREKDTVTLQEELEFLESYQFLLQIRHGDTLHFDIHVNGSALWTKIPPLTLQMLVENAIKHNVVSAARPLTVKIFNDSDKLTVTNNLQPKHIRVESDKVGLVNIGERYRLMGALEVVVSQTDTAFTVELPLLVDS